VSEPHPWLGLDYREILPHIRTESRSVGITVTRPSGHSYGEGALRVLRVLNDAHRIDLLLSYERYQSPRYKKEPRD
jgi:hypothetical protein